MYSSKRKLGRGGEKNCIVGGFTVCMYPLQYVILVNKSLRMRWMKQMACRGEKGNAYWVLMGKPEEQWPLGSPECRSENIKLLLKKQDGRMWTRMI
jgi:hypothetical protein